MKRIHQLTAGTFAIALASVVGLPIHASASGISKGPYLQNPTQTEVTVCWVSDTEAVGEVSYKPLTGSGASETVKEDKPVTHHKVRIKGLASYTRYSYEVLCQDRKGAGTFLTAAKPNQPFKFIGYGDNRTQPDKHAAVLRTMIPWKPDFVIQSGDLVADGTKEDQWTVFWETAKPLVKDTAYFPALGNHEREGAPYFKYFEVPQEYSFEYGNTHFVAIDSNRPDSEFKAQEEWLRKDLLAHKSATWRVVFFHHTPMTCVDMAARRSAADTMLKRLEPIFKEGNAQLIVNGHDHNYQHHMKDGIHYIVSGGGGAPLYKVVKDTPYVVQAETCHNHVRFEVNGKKMTIEGIREDGTSIEKFEVTTK